MQQEQRQLAAAFAAGAFAAAGVILLVRPRRWNKAVHVQKPHPRWTAPEKQPPPFDADSMHDIDPATYPTPELYPLVISCVVPRPIGFASTMAKDGTVNLAPYSYFNVLGHNPFIVALGVCRSPSRGGGKKDTLQNIEETKEFTINIMSEWFVEVCPGRGAPSLAAYPDFRLASSCMGLPNIVAANHTCGEYDRGVDEFQVSGLTPVPSQRIKPPRVRESAVQLECRLNRVIDFKDKTSKDTVAVVIGEVVMLHVADGVSGRSPTGKLVVDPVKLAPVCRLGGFTYGRVTELYDIRRPDKSGVYPGSPPAAAAEKKPQ